MFRKNSKVRWGLIGAALFIIGTIAWFTLSGRSFFGLTLVHATPDVFSARVINAFTLLDDILVSDKVDPRRTKGYLARWGVFNGLILEQTVTAADPIYRMFSSLRLDPARKKQVLDNLTDGMLKVFADLGTPGNFENNWKLFEAELARGGDPRLTGPPDFIIISHRHGANYQGGLELFQKIYPFVPIFITPDMVDGFEYYDMVDPQNPRAGVKNWRKVRVQTPVVLPPGTTVLTDRLAIVTLPFREPNFVVTERDHAPAWAIPDRQEYENVMSIRTRSGPAMFAACMHASLDQATSAVIAVHGKPIWFYCGGFEDRDKAIARAWKISPRTWFLLDHCGGERAANLAFVLHSKLISRIALGNRIALDF